MKKAYRAPQMTVHSYPAARTTGEQGVMPGELASAVNSERDVTDEKTVHDT